MVTLSDLTPAEQNALPYPELCRLRRQAYAAHAATMQVPEALTAWAATMERRHRNPKVQAWANQVPWLVALLIVRYGEAVEHWPDAFTEKDVQRAMEWAGGKIPVGIALIEE